MVGRRKKEKMKTILNRKSLAEYLPDFEI